MSLTQSVQVLKSQGSFKVMFMRLMYELERGTVK